MTAVAEDRPIDLTVVIDADGKHIEADWTMPLHPRGVVLILAGAGCSRFSRRLREAAHGLYDDDFATLIVDLLTPDEEAEDELTGALRLDVDFMAGRIAAATRWVRGETSQHGLPVGYLASGVAAAGALVCAARNPGDVDAIVSRGGRPDLAGVRLHKVETPVLLIAGGADTRGVELNKWALRRLDCRKQLEVVPDATQFLDEAAGFQQACRLGNSWFRKEMRHLALHSLRPALSIEH